MEHLFTTLSHAVEGSASIALCASLIWGILSVLLSPCHLSSIPLIIGFISEQGELTIRRAFLLSVMFSTGILITIGVIGGITASMGKMLGRVGPWSNYLVAAVFLLVGLHLIGILPSPFNGPGNVNVKRRGIWASFVLGLVFGIALGPCTFAFMAPVLAVSVKTATQNPMHAFLLLAFYGIGHCAVIVTAGTFTEMVERYLGLNTQSKCIQIIKCVCGILVLVGGVYMIYQA